MRLQKLHVEGFGKLNDVVCGLDAPVTIVYGPNEAGKSTMLGFVRSMLFGFAGRGSMTERLEPVNGGRHGGRLFFADESGQSYVMERYGSSSGKVMVRHIAADEEGGDRGDSLTQPQWERIFLGGVSERVFRELFAITLTELQAIGMLEGDELGKQLYHAGWNGGSAIMAAEKLLQGEMDELFKPRGSNQQMSKVLKALDETEVELRKLEDGISAFNGLTIDIEGTENELAEVEQRLSPLREIIALLLRAVEIRPAWLKRLALLQELEALKDAPRLAADVRSRWEALSGELRRAREELREAAELASVLEVRMERLNCDQTLLARKTDIETLMLSAEQTTASRLSVIELQAETAEHAEAAKRLLRRISPHWTEASLREFQAGVADRETVRVHRTALQEAEKALHLAEAEHRAASQRERDAAAQLAELGADANDLVLSGTLAQEASGSWPLEARGEALADIFRLLPRTADALRYAARQFEEAWRELELAELQEQHEAQAAASGTRSRGSGDSGSSATYWAASGLLAAGAVVLAAADMPAAAAAVGAAAIALAAPALLRQARPRGTGRGARSDRSGAGAPAAAAAAEQRVLAVLGALVAAPSAALALLRGDERVGGSQAAAHAQREAAAGRAGARAAGQGQPRRSIAAAGPAQLLVQLRAAIDARQDELRALASSAARRTELTRAHARLHAQEEAAGAAVEAAAQTADAIAAEWRDWLTARTLPPVLSPEAAMETLDLAEQAQLRIQALDRAAGKAALLREGIAAFDRSVAALSDAFPNLAFRANGDAVTALRLLQAEADKQAAVHLEQEELKSKQAEQAGRKTRLEQTLEDLLLQQERWFAAGMAADEFAWLNVLEQSERLTEIEQEMFKLNVQLTAGLVEAEQTRLETWFTDMDEAALRGMLADAQKEWTQAEQDRTGLLEQLGRNRQRMEQLLRDGDRQRLIGEREQATAALEGLISRYAVLSISMTMIKRTKRMMEEQRQPGVLREASRLMGLLSDGRYKRISMPEGERTIALETQDGRIVESGYLSRGTAEQLYLAMRFALADEAAAVHTLPLLLDDPFVNFDSDRLQAAAEVLMELAERRQIVFFTCHAHMRELLLERIPGAQLIRLTS